MDFTVTRDTDDFQVVHNVVMPIMVLMVDFQLAVTSLADTAVIRVMRESQPSVTSNPIGIVRVIFQNLGGFSFRVKSTKPRVFTFLSAMNSLLSLSRKNVKNLFALSTSFLNSLLNRVMLMKACTTTELVRLIMSINSERASTFFADLRVSNLHARGCVACLTAIKLPLIVTRDFLGTVFAIHKRHYLRFPLLSQTYRRSYG